MLRLLGIIGFGYLVLYNPNAPVAFYVLLAGLLGLPNIIGYQIDINRERQRSNDGRRRGRGGDDF